MLTQFYTTEEDATLCSMIWGTNFTFGPSTTTTTITSIASATAIATATATATTSSIINYNNNSNIIYRNVVVITNDNGLIASSAALNGNVNGDYINAAAAAAAAAADKSISGDRNTIINSVSVGDNLRDDLYIIDEDPRTETLREYSYGVILPIICSLGIIGNMLNLIVLTRRNMRGTAYIYMRAYSTAALLAIVFAIPFGIRMLVHKDRGQWQEFGPAFYTAHLELFLGNGCLGVGVMMLLILTIERYVSVCHPSFTRPVMGPPGLIVFLTTILTFIIYVPSVFRGELIKCTLQNHTYHNSMENNNSTNNNNGNNFVYFRRDNKIFQKTIFYSIYKVMLEVIFKLIPTVLIAGLNLRIMMVYRQTCEKRRKMILTRSTYIKDDDPRKFAEERRLFLLLGSTSILFLVCVSPMAILHMTIASEVLPIFSFQVFRASANLLELTNYSMTFYIYCLFSEDFRNTLIRTIKWPWIKGQLFQQVNEVTTKQIPLSNFDKLTIRNHHITTTSGVCTGIGRSSSI